MQFLRRHKSKDRKNSQLVLPLKYYSTHTENYPVEQFTGNHRHFEYHRFQKVTINMNILLVKISSHLGMHPRGLVSSEKLFREIRALF